MYIITIVVTIIEENNTFQHKILMDIDIVEKELIQNVKISMVVI